MPDRTGQVWEEHGVIFTVVGAPVDAGGWERHPVCFLDRAGGVHDDESHMDEGGIPWEEQPYMKRVG